MPILRRRDRSKRENTRPTEEGAVANVVEECKSLGVSLVFLMACYRSVPRPVYEVVRVSRYELACLSYRQANYPPPLFTTYFGELGKESYGGID